MVFTVEQQRERIKRIQQQERQDAIRWFASDLIPTLPWGVTIEAWVSPINMIFFIITSDTKVRVGVDSTDTGKAYIGCEEILTSQAVRVGEIAAALQAANVLKGRVQAYYDHQTAWAEVALVEKKGE